jgi:Ca-activated chloride channel family protein
MGKAKGPIARRPDGGFVFGWVDVEIDEDLLKEIAKKTGGRYYRATNMESLEDVYKEIDKMEKTKIEKTTLRRNRDEFKWFVFLALFSIILYIVFANTIFRSIVQ